MKMPCQMRKLIKRYVLSSFALVMSLMAANHSLTAQNPWSESPELTLSGYLNVFYTYDINQPDEDIRQPFFYSFNRHNEFNINLAYLGMSVSQAKYRASLKLQAGTYPNDNYAAEPGLLKNLLEAYAGISLNRRNNLWLEAGVFPSHLGFESPVAIENWTLTRSLANENSPYFLTGAKLTYTPSRVVEIMGIVCNGWQRIQRVEGNSFLSAGTQLVIRPKEGYTINWSTFIGTDDPDVNRRMMYFSNLFAVMQFSEKWGLIAGFDMGTRQEVKGSNAYDTWYALSAIARYRFATKWSATLRGEYYADEDGVIVALEGLPEGFMTSGISINFDYLPIQQVACRVEARWLHSPDDAYPNNGTFVQDNVFFTASIEVKMDRILSGKKDN